MEKMIVKNNRTVLCKRYHQETHGYEFISKRIDNVKKRYLK
jgi:hypothetical protein